MASVVFRGVTKRFGDATALDNVSLEIAHGQLVCLLGPSGCGKTTALRLLAGFLEPTAGEIALGDRIVSSPKRTLPPEQRNVSMVFQSYALWPHMTVAQNVAYGLEIRKLDKAAIAKKVESILSTTQLAALAERYPAELSGGQQQRVSLARALIVEPETLLLDEPLSNLDANLREEMRFEVRRLHDTYRYTTVYVTHDQSEAMTTADLIAVMSAGRVEQLGSPQEVYERPRSEFVARFLGGSNIVRAKALDAAHVSIAGTSIACTGEPMTPAPTCPSPSASTTSASRREPPAMERAAGHGRAQRLPRQRAGLYRCGKGRHPAAHHRAAGGRLRARRFGVARPAAGQMPGIGRLDDDHRRKRHGKTDFATARRAGPFGRRRCTAPCSAPASWPPRRRRATSRRELIEAARKEGKVVWYTAVDLPVAERIAKAFEAKYPGIPVRVERSGGERIFQRISQEYSSKHPRGRLRQQLGRRALHRLEARRHPPALRDRGRRRSTIPPSRRTPTASSPAGASGCASSATTPSSSPARTRPRATPTCSTPSGSGKIVKAHPGYSGTIMTATYQISRDIGWGFFEKLAQQRVMQVQSSADPPKRLAPASAPSWPTATSTT